MPRPIIYILLVLVALSLIPMGLLYKAHATRGRETTRVQIVYDMDQQFYYEAQQPNPFFADGRGMRDQIEGTIARGGLMTDTALHMGQVEGDTLYVEAMPIEVTREVVDRGQDRFNIHCAPCHGLSGNGNGPVHQRATALGEGNWAPPTDLASQAVVDQPVGQIYHSIKYGIRTMPAYGPQISVEDRWAIVAYVRAIQASRGADFDDLPEAVKQQLQ